MNSSTDSPPAAERFIKMLAQSGLVNREVLRRLLTTIPTAVRHHSAKLAESLVEQQVLTSFQATKLLQGTWHGLVLGPYQVLAPLGRGGMGTVYLVRNTRAMKGEKLTGSDAQLKQATLPGLVALKVLPPKRAKEEQRTLARFLREMDMCQRVSHPHLTKTFDAGEIEGVYYIAMEYIRGVSLSQLVKANGPLPAERAARLFSELAAGLSHAHSKGLIHRDLKPSNIMVTPNGHGKILDLGLAIMLDERLPVDKTIVGGQGYVVGTMDYIAPEQVDNPTEVDARADLYALGCSLFFALTGQPPFPGGTSIQKMQRHRLEYAEPIPDLNPTVPVEFARIVENLMQKKPAKRYRSAEQVRQALLPWAAADIEKPLDVNPMMSEAEAIELLEQEQSRQPGLWWEEVPGISFEATAKYGKHSDEPAPDQPDQSPVDEPESTKNAPLLAIALVVALVLLVLLLEFIRH